MGKYTVITEEGEKIILNITKHHTAKDFIDEILKYAGGAWTISSIYHHVVDQHGKETTTKVMEKKPQQR